jgi:serine/threonine-protein kinase
MNISHPNSDYPVDLTGNQLGGFSIIRRLGRGGMADVYLARQDSLQRNVALKILKPELARDRSFIDRFQREAQSAAKLVQANIVQIYEVGQADGYHYIAQEYVVGRNLREYLNRNGAVKPVVAVNILRQVALALQKANDCNVVHRDIKPENIMLAPNGEVKVADFGLARVNDDSQKNLTQIGVTMGTPLYMSPEQIDGRPLDIRSDIYSLGITAYHMLAGRPPFDGGSALAIAVKHINDQPESLSAIRPDLPPALIELVQQMMAKQVADRPRDAAEILRCLKNIQVGDEEDWEKLVETLAIRTTRTEPQAAARVSMLETRQLQTIMMGHRQHWLTRTSTLLTILALIAAGTIFGNWLAAITPTRDPLSLAETEIRNIPKMDSVKQQYELATRSHPYDPDYYQAVLDYFPLESSEPAANQIRLYHDRAKERMAEIYLSSSDFSKAEAIYKEFTLSDSQRRCFVVGHAGLAIVYHLQNKPDLAKSQISQVESQVDSDKKLNAFLSRKFAEVREFYSQTSFRP